MPPTFLEQRRQLKSATRRRVRGGERKAPVRVQRIARQVSDGATVARDAGARVASSNKPYILAVVAVLVLGATMLVAPLQQYLDGRGRVELLEQKIAALQHKNGTLSDRAQALADPDNVELLAREQQGYHLPGEVPYAVVPPAVDRERIADPREDPDVAERPWYSRIWDAVLRVFG